MSTRCNVIVRGCFGEEIIFYRHSDGYPESVIPSLTKLLEWSDVLRNNASQFSGWLILLGHLEYLKYTKNNIYQDDFKPSDWKVGAYEPTTGIHGDIEYLYILDLKEQKIYIDGENGFTYRGKFSEADV